MGKFIGLDIGIASVGWAVVENDDSAKIIELGSNIFDSADASKNETRRQMRQTRRLLRRRKNRIKDFNKLWIKYGFEVRVRNINNQLELRLKGLTKELSNEELYAVLVSILKHRGISYLEEAFNDEKGKTTDYQKGININQEELKSKLPCEIQYDRLRKYNKYRGVTLDDTQGIALINVFTISSYKREITKLLETQQRFNDKISAEFIQEYIKIFNRKREYYVGPGNEKSRTDYGKYTTKKDANGKYITESNIFEKLIGKSSIILGNETDDEMLRASAASYTAQEFNVLNDLNNILIGGRKLTQKEKIDIIDKLKNQETKELKYTKVEKIIADVTSEDVNTIVGNRIDREENPEYHNFRVYRLMKKELVNVNHNYDDFDRNQKDKIAHILTINTEKVEIIKRLREDIGILDEKLLDKFVEIRKKNASEFSKWHSLSIKVMNHLIPYMYDTSYEQNTLITNELKDQKLKRNIANYSINTKYINKNLVLSEIYNPVVKRSISITIDILNALIKKYEDIQYVVIEMPRDKNEDNKKKRERDVQKKNEQEIQRIKSKLHNEYSIINIDEKLSKIKNLSLKLKLWNEQDEKCLYSGEHIDIDDLISNPNNYEIDHIIPLSISFDDSRNNKVLVKQIENQSKTNMTPYMYLNSSKKEYDYAAFKSLVKLLEKSGKLNKKKVHNLLFEEDITKIDVLKGFISRNLNDTRYASRVVLNSCQEHFKNVDRKAVVKVIRGSFTSQMRNRLSLPKDREESFAHHAIDAALICYSQMGYNAYKSLTDKYINFETGEVIDERKLHEGITESEYEDIMYNTKWKVGKDNLIEAEKHVKYWYKIDKKVNRQLCNQTIRGTREINGEIYKINSFDIYTTRKLDLEKKLIDKKESLLMYMYDKKTYDDLMVLFDRYNDAANPFVEAKKNGEVPRKYSKDNNGPEITKIKYLDGKVGSCIDISHKFGHEKGAKKVILESLNPYRSDFYYSESEKRYAIAGVRYSDLKCNGKHYVIDRDAYNNILISEGIIKEGETVSDIEKNGYKFLFTLYRNDLFEYVDENDNIYAFRFHARNSQERVKSQIEVKPIERGKYSNEKDGFVQNTLLYSLYTYFIPFVYS